MVSAMPQFHGGKADVEKLNYDSLYNKATTLDQAPEGRQLLEHCIEAHGGRERLAAIDGGKALWGMASTMSGDTMAVTRTWDNQRRYRIEKRNGDRIESRWLCGDEAWFQTPDTLVSLSGTGRYNAELFSYLVLRMPLAAEEAGFDDVRYADRSADDSLEYLYCMKQDTLMLVLGIDRESHLIRQVEGVIYQGEQYFVFVNYFGDHAPVDGVVFPHALTNVAMGVIVGYSRLEKVLFDEALPADFCEPRKYPAATRAH